MSEDGGELLTVRETAQRLNVHENTVRNMAEDGRLTPVHSNKASRYRKFRVSEVDQVAADGNVTRVPAKDRISAPERKRVARMLRKQAAALTAMADAIDPQ
jgi:excisionase family DNA binding protein